ncbi:MAG: N-acetylmuramoyl-L-alanine amidase [Pseudoflavonifractor sp.]|nr:N-acetylmuramoyl-L-alanine amidase [Pseudoflavonifractor sp.]
MLTPWKGINAKLAYNGVALGDLRPDGLYDMGAETALTLDSVGNSQCDFGGGQSIYSNRRVNNYMCIWLKKDSQSDDNKEETPVSNTVCLDPGHGPDTVNGSPDGSYKEKEFTWDMCRRLRPLLEAQGMEVIVTRTEDEKPSLTVRADVSNKAGAELFVSLHSNASESGWTTSSGFVIYTSAAGDTAGRNKAASAILARMKEAGVAIFGSGLQHNPEYTVLTATTAPAMIVEYGFHTNKSDVALLKDSAYRDKLAVATAKGICDYLGVAYKDAPMEEAPVDDPTDWAAAAWLKVKDKGVMDGTRPTDGITRQELAVVLDRLGLI